MLAVVVNHEHTAQALALRAQLSAVVNTVTIDSGSRLSTAERGAFDVCLPNVYYSALLNEAATLALARQAAALLFVTSDVRIDDAAALVDRARRALAGPDVGVYGPCSQGSNHGHMRPRRTHRLREVPFVEGFCFATRVDLLAQLCPVDLTENRMGWGLDMHLGYLALSRGLRCVVDDDTEVVHPRGTGYSLDQARREYRKYKKTVRGLQRFSLLIDSLFAKHFELSTRLLRAAVRP